ncbi:hypothetical protein [Ciceribacter sp. L1K22]|uniref:hypothetical protein n=1 Tax=Ciceribacter sp. L1K22 TaxID=2820275 RepID=UPI001ABD9CE5|nr:hypothetical protein [Ciceribacter sp. L1K22]MBO3760815.1 hypothetical protein [Ciceribacter sp. L1K22]
MNSTIDTATLTSQRRPPTPTRLADEAERAAVTRYPAAAFRGPLFETRDRIALGMAALMLIGPLAVMPLGLG